MLKVSPETVHAFVAANATSVRFQFISWMETYVDIVGTFQRDIIAGAYESFAKEAEEAGIDKERRRFVFTAAMLMMPEMTAAQYLRTLDIVFSDDSASSSLQKLVALKGRPGG